MHLRGLDLNLLIILDVLLAERNVTRTGERVHLSQSATSGALSRLREFFDDQLLVQVGQRMELTPFAEMLSEEVHDVISKCEAIVDKNQKFDPETSTRTFRLNISDASATVVMNKAISLIQQQAPHIRLDISSIIDGPISEYLNIGVIDLIVTPEKLVSTQHPSEFLFDDQFVCVVWSGNPLCNTGIDLNSYLSSGHIVARFSKMIGWAMDEVFLSESGYQRRIDIVVPSFSMLMTQLIGTNLIATVHERFARYYAKYLPITMFPCPVNTVPFGMKLQWHRHHDGDLGIQWLRNVMHSSVSDIDPLS
ncbi:LysR family transcriptional regulator [Kosakonia sp. ML.JS2a]|uniref:LysR family transcriptional regulator n=1 Tax=Kosakonia sp. ML.JS2a TaxID=2980557 RepID=UPI0021DA01B4|nr:LysR family transcriptional regulator [Kosakonia sp. ML.JS2a]UXY09850.1 LysR family transcriptional regulator [Kosakonia sp. ML.JS2a]